jgi:acetyl esterase/lipase
MRSIPLIFAAAMLLTPLARAQSPRNSAQVESAKPFQLLRDVPYETVDGSDLRLDVAVPAGPGPYPLILCIHGGAWRMGDKSKFISMLEDFARRGYVAASMNYRFAPKYRFPSQLDDTKAALCFLKNSHQRYKIDVNHVGAVGESAGSHLAMLMSFTSDPKDDDPLTSTRLQAIANYYGPVDLTNWQIAPLVEFLWKERFKESMESAMLDFLGAKSKESPEVIKASPLTYVSKNCPPILTFHGTLDPVVPFHQAEVLHATLRKFGVDEKLVPIPNGMHGGWTEQAKKSADEQTFAFFDQYLKGSTTQVVIPHRRDTASAEHSPASPRSTGDPALR